MSSGRRLSSAHRQTRQIVEALRSGKSGGIADLIEPAKDPHARPGNSNARKEENAVAIGNPVSPKTKGSHKSETIIARLKRDATTDPQAEALLGKTYRQRDSDRNKPSTATLPLERGEVLAKGG